MNELTNKIEAILYASGKGVTEEDLANYCETKPKAVQKAIEELQKNLEERNGSLLITEHNDKWKLTVKGKYTPLIQAIVSETELPNPILKTLAVIAYKSPVMQSDIVNMRGQGAYEHIKTLVKEKFITKEESGRTFILKITDKFYNYFDVEGDEEIREIFANLRKQQQKMTELEIVTIANEELATKNTLENQQKLGNLAIVDVNPNREQDKLAPEEETKPRTKEKNEEEKREEEAFLDNIDKKIDEISKHVKKQELPKREEHKKEEEETNKKDDADENSLEQLEEFADSKNESEENYL